MNNRERILSCDFGNFELKFASDDAAPRSIRSLHYQLPRGVNGLVAKPNSPLIELTDGTRYHVGTQALKYSSSEKTVTQDKSLLARLHLYACLDTPGDVRLVVSHHSPDVYRNTLKLALTGNHSFKRNGVNITAKVTDVEVATEGQGAYWLAKESGYISETGYTVVIDIGGGSWLSTVYDAEGDAIAHHVADKLGTYHLANQIANDARLKTPLRSIGVTAPDPALILDGFRMGHRYGETSASWSEWLDEYLESWYRGIFGTIKTQYQPHMQFVRRFVVTGGGAHLIASKVKKSSAFVVMPDPNTANVVGMLQRFSSSRFAAIA